MPPSLADWLNAMAAVVTAIASMILALIAYWALLVQKDEAVREKEKEGREYVLAVEKKLAEIQDDNKRLREMIKNYREALKKAE